MNRIQILNFLDALKDSDYYIQFIFIQGGCYQLFKVLKTLDNRAMPYIDSNNKDHIITRIGGCFYDINGLASNEGYIPLTNEMANKAKRWSFSKNYFLSIRECPYCEEPIFIDVKKYSNRLNKIL